MILRSCGVKGLPYSTAAIFAWAAVVAVLRGGDCGGSVHPSFAKSNC
jgi:hypothetical protein